MDIEELGKMQLQHMSILRAKIVILCRREEIMLYFDSGGRKLWELTYFVQNNVRQLTFCDEW